MDKIAQKRDIFNKIREQINRPGAYFEGFFRPEMERILASLKRTDDSIRSELTGKKIGDAVAPADPASAKELLKSARSNCNRREYMAAIADLGHFHKKMWDTVKYIDGFKLDVSKIHDKFLFSGLENLKDTRNVSYNEKLQKLRDHMTQLQTKAETTPEYFIKEAGILDFFHNISTKRGFSLATWEKKYPKQTKALREETDRLINEAQKLFDNTISHLKEMATARAIRRPDDYVTAGTKIKEEFDKFDSGEKGFRAYYNSIVLPLLIMKDNIEQAAKKPEMVADPTKSNIELGIELPTRPMPPTLPSAPPTPVATPAPVPSAPSAPSAPLGGPPGVSPPFTPPPEETAPDTEKSPKVKKSHEQFFKSLESMSEEDPRILAGYISKYAKSIQEKDLDTAIKLFTIVRRLKG